MNNHENFSRFFVCFFVLALALFFGYKYFEYKTIREFVDFQNKAENQEYRLTEKMDQLSDRTSPLLNSFYGVGESTVAKKPKKTETELFTENYDLTTELINLNKIDIDMSNEYNGLLKNNLQNYNKYYKKLKFVLSQNSKLLRDYIDSQIIYYSQEIQNSDDGIISSAFMENYFKIIQENLIIKNLNKTFEGKNRKYYIDNYNMFSTLEKYTRSDFAFLKEDLIKTRRPYGYEWLDKSKKYFAAYYELTKEYTYGDEDSYNYKYEKFNTLLADFNIDMNKVFDENSSEYQEKAKSILKTVFDRFLIANKLKQNKFNIFPIFGKTNLVNANLVMCQSYPYRYSLYNNITNKYPAGENIDDVIKEFDTAKLSNKEADSTFDKTLLVFSESDNKATFECKDPNSGESFKFVINK